MVAIVAALSQTDIKELIWAFVNGQQEASRVAGFFGINFQSWPGVGYGQFLLTQRMRLYVGKAPSCVRRGGRHVCTMDNAARQWTREEQDNLFDIYFGPSAGICPVCAHEVCMVMSNLGRTVSLLLSCEGCDNKARVSRILPLDGPLHRTDPNRVVPSRGIRTHGQDESQSA